MKLIKIFIILSLIAFSSLGLYIYSQSSAKYEGENAYFTISPGQGFSKINYRLYKEGFINNPSFFYRYVQFKNKLTNFQAGTYEILSGMTAAEVLHELTEGQPILSKVTLPEGRNLYEVAKIMDEAGICNEQDFINTAKDQKLVEALNITAPSLEGYLYPETYKFAPKTSAKIVIETMIDTFNKRTKDLDFSKSNLSKHEVIILASIVEKETGAGFERPIIAGVYLNRLKKPMRLQADPTTIYGIWETYNGNLRKRHLLERTAYNTYKLNGLPLGPIANPSIAAIDAVLNPNQHNYLYFVSKNDGTHVFTPNYKEHLNAVREFQLNINNREGKSWRDLKKN